MSFQLPLPAFNTSYTLPLSYMITAHSPGEREDEQDNLKPTSRQIQTSSGVEQPNTFHTYPWKEEALGLSGGADQVPEGSVVRYSEVKNDSTFMKLRPSPRTKVA